ncbi:hypothetical protein CCP4SC76_4250004 [Gammaproteobacteria bacterium]
MKLRTDTIGHFENPTEDVIRNAVVYSGEGAREGDLVKLVTDEGDFLCIWIGRRSTGHTLIFKSGPWKLECTEKLSSEMVVDLMVSYLHEDLSSLKEFQWKRPFDQVFLDNLNKLKK